MVLIWYYLVLKVAIAAVVCMVTDLYITYDIDRILIISYLTMPTGWRCALRRHLIWLE